jgi:acyl-CoA synthetase (AMP-forming)/AMP-acid ligase II
VTPATIPAALDRAAAVWPAAEAVVDGDVRLTFRDLRAHALDVARALVASGVSVGDRVALWAPNSADWIATSFGIYYAGAVLVPLNTRYRGEEAGHILRTSGARLLFTVGSFLDVDYVASLSDVPGLEGLSETVVMPSPEFLARGASVPVEDVVARASSIGADDISDIIFTSGTTGAPKGAMLRHGASVETYLSWSSLVDLREGDRYLCVYPFFHTAGLKSGVLACVLRGAAIHPQPVFDVPVVLSTVAREGITMLPGPPTVFQTIVNHPDLASFDLSSVRSSVTGAAVVPVETIRQMRSVLGIRTVVTGYGMTETTGTISMCRFDDPPEVIATTVGRPIPGVSVRIADDGEILVKGFNVMAGYFGDPAATAAAFDSDGWLMTGDVGFVDDDGNLHITDRKKDMFIVGGFNAYPAEIEAVLLQHPSVAQVAVVGAPDPRLGEIGVAFVVPTGDAGPLDPDDLLQWAWERLAKFKLARVELVDALPLNPTGKVQKFKLRERLGSRDGGDQVC